MALSDLRKDYSLAGLGEKDLAKDPFRQFETWFQEAEAARVPEPNAMILSTCSREGQPSSRVVLLKGFDGRGFVFFSNYESRKGREIASNPAASLLFPWIVLERQVIVEGSLARITREETDAYFQTRPRASQLAAWVSQQSSVVPDRRTLEEGMKAIEARYAGQEVPTPPHWGGYRLVPERIEFWQGRRSRLHDRLRYRRERPGSDWIIERLSP